MNPICERIVSEYREERESFVKIGEIVSEKINAELRANKIMTLTVAHRVKEEQSLIGKIQSHEKKYRFLSDLTDILGVRIVSYFSDDVDKIASIIEELFEIDRENSVDKRAKLAANSFGYLSLHYICSLKDCDDEQLKGKKFEIQIRSTLQHVWAEIEHDLGYKTEFGVPKAIRREFSRVAGLLEIADDHFAKIRLSIHEYTAEIKQKIADDCADDISIDLISLKEYVANNSHMRNIINEIASICDSEVTEISPENYLEQLEWLGKQTLGDISNMITENHDIAMKLAQKSLAHTELDILSSNVGLRYICHAELLTHDYNREQIINFLLIAANDKTRAAKKADQLLTFKEKYNSGII